MIALWVQLQCLLHYPLCVPHLQTSGCPKVICWKSHAALMCCLYAQLVADSCTSVKISTLTAVSGIAGELIHATILEYIFKILYHKIFVWQLAS